MRTNRLTLVLCACVAALFGCGAEATDQPPELGEAEQAQIDTIITDDSLFTMGLACTNIDSTAPICPTEWAGSEACSFQQYLYNLRDSHGAFLWGLRAASFTGIRFDSCKFQGTSGLSHCDCPNNRGRGSIIGTVDNHYTDWQWMGEETGSSAEPFRFANVGPVVGGRRKGMQVFFSDSWASKVFNTICPGTTGTASRFYADCRSVGKALGLKTDSGTSSCMGALPTNCTNWHQRQGYTQTEIDQIASILDAAPSGGDN